jgi:hypothetical protein
MDKAEYFPPQILTDEDDHQEHTTSWVVSAAC